MELQEDSASMHRKTKILNLFRNKLGRFDSSIERIFVSDVAFFFYMFYVCWIDNYAIENFFLMKLKHDESYIKDFNRKKYFLFLEKKTLRIDFIQGKILKKLMYKNMFKLIQSL